jgi:hypothetical protein
MRIGPTFTLALLCLALAPAAARADEQHDRAACMVDAITVCSQFIPDRERIAACLYSNRTRISAACQDAIKRYNPRTASD